MSTEARTVLQRPDLLIDRSTHYCPGCGHGVVHRLVAEVLGELGLGPRTIAVAGVGCAVFAYDYLRVDFCEAPHGRAPAVATGIRRVRPDAFVLTYQGDGDMAAIGTAEIVHAAARGSASPRLRQQRHLRHDRRPDGPDHAARQRTVHPVVERGLTGFPLRITEMLVQLPGVSFAARGSVVDAAAIGKTKAYIKRACQAQLEGGGFAIVEILSNCPVGWGMNPVESMDWLRDRVIPEYPVGILRTTPRSGADWRTTWSARRCSQDSVDRGCCSQVRRSHARRWPRGWRSSGSLVWAGDAWRRAAAP
jgi:2-oxoglutarate ferredoxin oxidoreductase subunit beta